MAATRRQTGQRGSGQGLPGWGMLLIGLIIGLFVAFLVWLQDIDPDPEIADAPAAAISGDDEEQASRPRFEFYSILPELEIVVPEFDLRERMPQTVPDQDAPPIIDEAPDIADDEATYFLQVGSFREAGQADQLKAELSLIGLDVDVHTVKVNGDRWHRVRVGPLSGSDNLRNAQNRLRDNDFDYLVLRGRG